MARRELVCYDAGNGSVLTHARESPEATRMWEDSRYCWVVHCKNHWYHVRKNLFYRHRIPLAETDAVTPRPPIDCRFRARCDECGKEYFYKPSEVLRFEQEPPASFLPHPLFADQSTSAHPVVPGPRAKAASAAAGGKSST